MSDSARKFSNIDTKASASPEAADFQPENFVRAEDVRPIPDPNQNFDLSRPDKGPIPDPFAEFEVDRKPLSKFHDDLPSLAGLFHPFDLSAEKPEPKAQDFEDIFSPEAVSNFIYEDMDLRDPDVIRTLSHAEEKAAEMILNAQQEAARIIDSAATEAKVIEKEAGNQAEMILSESKAKAEALALSLAEAEELHRQAEHDRAEADAQLSSAADRIANIDNEKAQLEAEFEAKKTVLEEQYAAQAAEFQATVDQASAEGRDMGYQEGLQKGLEEGRNQGRNEIQAQFQEQIDKLINMLEKTNNLYNDLWSANGPMMVQLAIEAAGQILNKELQEAKDLTVRAFIACIDYLNQANKVTFFANPNDITLLEQARADQRERLGALVKVSFKADETLGPGDLIMESDVGRLDATVKHRSNEVLSVLRQAFSASYKVNLPDANPQEIEGSAHDANHMQKGAAPQQVEERPGVEANTSSEGLAQETAGSSPEEPDAAADASASLVQEPSSDLPQDGAAPKTETDLNSLE